MRKLNVLTNSSTNCYLTCPQMYFFRYELCIVLRDSRGPLVFGDRCHHGLDAWWTGLPATWEPLDDEYEQAKLRAMLDGYHLRWVEWRDTSVTEVQSELEFRVPLINPETGAASTFWDVAGKLDKYAFVDGRPGIVEHKTSSDTSCGYFERLRIDSQISTYLMAAKELKLPEPEDVLYDVLKKPQIKPLKATPECDRKYVKATGKLYANQREADETPSEYYLRCLETIGENVAEYYQHYDVVRLESEVQRAAADLWFVGAMIRESKRLNRWPRNTRSCRNQYNKFCDYWAICSGAASPEDETLYEFKAPHSELSKGITE